MAKVYITRRTPGDPAEAIRDAGHEVELNPDDAPVERRTLLEAAAGCDGVLTLLSDRIDGAFFDAAGERLKVISNYAVGYNNIDVGEATRRGVAVCNTPDVLTEATADLAWALLLGVSRRVAEGDRLVRSGAWGGWKPDQLLGGELVGRTLAIVGPGRIGVATARRSVGWRMKLLYVARSRHERLERELGAERRELDAALAEADFVSLHVPLTEQSHHLIDRDRLRRMKRSAYLVNTSRGAVIEEAALVEALREGWIAGAGLDVYEAEPALAPGLADCSNALLLPHLGSATHATRSAMGRLAAENLLAVLAGRRPKALVNPAVAASLKLEPGD
jgi:glyoxylate reductase